MKKFSRNRVRRELELSVILSAAWLLIRKYGRPWIVQKSGFHARHFLDVLYCFLNDVWFYKGGKCGWFVIINKAFFEVNPPYGQSDSTVNLNPWKIWGQISTCLFSFTDQRTAYFILINTNLPTCAYLGREHLSNYTIPR